MKELIIPFEKLNKKFKKMIENYIEETKRPCTPSESLAKSLQEMQLIKQGKLQKRTWNELKEELKNEG